MTTVQRRKGTTGNKTEETKNAGVGTIRKKTTEKGKRSTERTALRNKQWFLKEKIILGYYETGQEHNGKQPELERGRKKPDITGKVTTEDWENRKRDNGKQPEKERRQRKTAGTVKRTTENSQNWKADNGKQPELESGQRKTARGGKRTTENSQNWKADNGKQAELERGNGTVGG